MASSVYWRLHLSQIATQSPAHPLGQPHLPTGSRLARVCDSVLRHERVEQVLGRPIGYAAAHVIAEQRERPGEGANHVFVLGIERLERLEIIGQSVGSVAVFRLPRRFVQAVRDDRDLRRTGEARRKRAGRQSAKNMPGRNPFSLTFGIRRTSSARPQR